MYFKTKSSIVFFSIVLGLLSFWVTSPDSTYAQTATLDLGVEGESKIKVDDKTDLDTLAESEITVKSKTDLSVGYDANASEQPGSQNTTKQSHSNESQINIMTGYPKANADSNNSFLVQSKNSLYKPGDAIVVEGSVWSNLLSQIGTDSTISVQILDSKNNVVQEKNVKVKTDGSFDSTILLPENSLEGQYTIKSRILSDSSILSKLEGKTRVETTSRIIVSNPNPIKIKIQGHDDFVVDFSSNSEITQIKFNEDEKKISFNVEGETGTKGVTQIKIPKLLLSGQLMVMIDGEIMASDKVIATSSTETSTTLELNYHHSVHSIEIVGTQAVPEFGTITMMIFGIAMISITVVMMNSRLIPKL